MKTVALTSDEWALRVSTLEQDKIDLQTELDQYIGGEANEYGQSIQKIIKLEHEVLRLRSIIKSFTNPKQRNA